MVAIEGALRIYVEHLERAVSGGGTMGSVAGQAATATLAKLDAIRSLVVQEARQVIGRSGADRIVTVSCSSTVMAVLDTGLVGSVLVGEGRPGLEGRALAGRYAGRGMGVTLCVDAALPGLLRRGDVVLVGADSIGFDGQVVNKIGTFALASAASKLEVPLYVAAESFKFSARASIPLETKDPDEVWEARPAGVEVCNPYFERTPPSLVTGFVTDLGVLRHGEGSWAGGGPPQ
jgi:translation initiation factor 2B subunit (eIF-2B alpha/beta/delta family)